MSAQVTNPHLHDVESVKLIHEYIATQTADARHDIVKFFEYVMREQTTRKRIKASPHQKVFLNFLMDHDRAVGMMPVGHSKTFCTEALTLFLLGQDPTLRGAIVSATQEQSKKVLGVVADYILHSAELRAVFNLRPSPRTRDPWTQTAITVDRPAGIPDASLYACGIDGGLPGARLSWVIIDDILNRQNTATKEGRDKVYEYIDSTVLARLDPLTARIIVINTAWHPDDFVHRLEKAGWPVIRMDILGNIQIQDDADWIRQGREPWDSPELRPATLSRTEENYRLKAHDPDPGNEVPLWPERFFYLAKEPANDFQQAVQMAHEDIAERRKKHLPAEFNRLFLNLCRDDGTSFCKQEYIDLSLRRAMALKPPVKSLVSSYEGNNLVFCGVDLAISPGEEHDDTAFFTFELLPDGTRLVLDVDIGQWSGPDILKKIFAKVEKFRIAAIRVENNGAQDYIRQFALDVDKSIPIKAHCTGRAKAHPEHGVPGIFLEMSNGAWAFPNDRGRVQKPMQRFADACLYYQPSRHTDDILMAAYFAREQAKEWGVLRAHKNKDTAGSTSLALLAR